MLAPDSTPSVSTTVCDSLLQLSVSNILKKLQDTADSAQLAAAFAISFEQMKLIELHTRQQRNSTLWHQLRQHRITASNFGAVLSAADRGVMSDSLFAKLKG